MLCSLTRAYHPIPEDFEFKEELGRGAHGVVHRVVSKRDRKVYVIKQVSVKRMKEKQRRNAVAEVLILRRLNHPNIVQYYNCFVANQTLCIVMEFAAKGDLYSIIESRRRSKKYYGERTLWRYFWQLCQVCKLAWLFMDRDVFALWLMARVCLPAGLDTSALETHCTSRFEDPEHIPHRGWEDKGASVCGLLGVPGASHHVHLSHVQIGDLGVSRLLGRDSNLQSRVGTPLYLAPELIRQEPYSYQVDIWSLGCVMYTLAALEAPFRGENLLALAQVILHKKPKPLPRFYTKSLSTVIASMLEKVAARRPNIAQVRAWSLRRRPLWCTHLTEGELLDRPQVLNSFPSHLSAQLAREDPPQPVRHRQRTDTATDHVTRHSTPLLPTPRTDGSPKLSSGGPPAPPNVAAPSAPPPPASVRPVATRAPSAPSHTPQSPRAAAARDNAGLRRRRPSMEDDASSASGGGGSVHSGSRGVPSTHAVPQPRPQPQAQLPPRAPQPHVVAQPQGWRTVETEGRVSAFTGGSNGSSSEHGASSGSKAGAGPASARTGRSVGRVAAGLSLPRHGQRAKRRSVAALVSAMLPPQQTPRHTPRDATATHASAAPSLTATAAAAVTAAARPVAAAAVPEDGHVAPRSARHPASATPRATVSHRTFQLAQAAAPIDTTMGIVVPSRRARPQSARPASARRTRHANVSNLHRAMDGGATADAARVPPAQPHHASASPQRSTSPVRSAARDAVLTAATGGTARPRSRAWSPVRASQDAAHAHHRGSPATSSRQRVPVGGAGNAVRALSMHHQLHASANRAGIDPTAGVRSATRHEYRPHRVRAKPSHEGGSGATRPGSAAPGFRVRIGCVRWWCTSSCHRSRGV